MNIQKAISCSFSDKQRILSAILLFLLFICIDAFADTTTTNTTGKVLIGAYINGIHSIDLKAGTVDLDLYIWLRTKGERNLLESFEVLNGSISDKSSIVKKKIGDENYYSMRITVKAFQNYDLRKFPLDNQKLVLFIEDSEEDITALQFSPDKENTKAGNSVSLPGWAIGKTSITVTTNSYNTNYGDISLGQQNSNYSRATIEIPISREGIGYFLKMFGTVFLAASVAFLSFFIRPDDLDPRFGLGVGGIFAVVASNFVLSSMLPETYQVTMGEALLLITIISIFVALLESVVSLKLWEDDKKVAALKLDSMAGWVVPISYLLICFFVITMYLY